MRSRTSYNDHPICGKKNRGSTDSNASRLEHLSIEVQGKEDLDLALAFNFASRKRLASQKFCGISLIRAGLETITLNVFPIPLYTDGLSIIADVPVSHFAPQLTPR